MSEVDPLMVEEVRQALDYLDSPEHQETLTVMAVEVLKGLPEAARRPALDALVASLAAERQFFALADGREEQALAMAIRADMMQSKAMGSAIRSVPGRPNPTFGEVQDGKFTFTYRSKSYEISVKKVP